MTDCEKFYQIYNAKKARSVPYSELEVLLNIDVLSVVGKDEKFSITQLASRLGFFRDRTLRFLSEVGTLQKLFFAPAAAGSLGQAYF